MSFGVTQDLGSSLGVGGAIAYDWTRNLGFEFELGRVFDVAGEEAALDISLTTISANFVYHFDVVHVTRLRDRRPRMGVPSTSRGRTRIQVHPEKPRSPSTSAVA